MVLDGLSDVFGALGLNMIVREVEGRQRPVILDGVGKGNCTNRLCWVISLFSSILVLVAGIKSPTSVTARVFPPSRKNQLSDSVVANIQARQRPNGGNAISTKVGSGLSLYLLVLPDGISESSHA